MSRISLQIETLARPIVETKNAFLIDVSVRGEHKRKVVEVFIDTDRDVTTELCSEISRELAQVLDKQNMFFGGYDLVVSSPGIGRPLKYFRQYPKNIGRKMTIKYKMNDQVERIEGELLKAEAEQITLRLTETEERAISFAEIVEAKVRSAW